MEFGQFNGEVVAQWLQQPSTDDRKMQLLEDFSYTDPKSHIWHAPKGSIIDGASIPSALWVTIGPPFVGNYRRASVIHDVACVEKSEPHESVHKMFYYAMRADGVGWSKANVMYQAVKNFGPRWNTANASIGPRKLPSEDEILAFTRTVEQAAAEISPAQGPDAVEQRMKELLEQTVAVSPETIKPTQAQVRTKKRQRPQSLSQVRKVTSKTKATSDRPAAPIQLENIQPAVRQQLESTCHLRHFRETARVLQQQMVLADQASRSSPLLDGNAQTDALSDDLSHAARLRLVEQALILLEQNYVHRPLKESMYAVNPVQGLRLLKEQLIQSPDTTLITDAEFHRKLATIFISTRDLHTNYFLPSPYAERTVYVPFLVEDFFDDDEPTTRRFLVTRVFNGFEHSTFVPGIEILRWNGITIERAVEINGDRYAGSNLEARRSRGLETLTVRSLIQSLPPDEDFVLVEYKTLAGDIAELRFDWLMFLPDTGSMPAMGELAFESAIAQGIDLEQSIVRFAKKVLFAPQTVAAAEKMSGRQNAKRGQGLTSLMPDVLQARPVELNQEQFGYVRIRTFSVENADRFVQEFIRLIEQLPQTGLIIDVRGNGGGLILAGEQLLQVLTPHSIQPTLFQFLNTPLNRRLVEKNDFLAPWRPSMRQAVQTGASYSQGLPITSVAKANEIGQRYHGPVVLITDGLCYSTTDIFAAGFQDHGIGTILGTDNNTGAGGANVWPHELLSSFLQTEDSPYRPLPSNAGMRVSIRRTIRVGKNNGTVLEDLGVVPDQLHNMTRDDLLRDNVDLIEQAINLLIEQPTYQLDVTVNSSGDDAILELVTSGVDRVDVYDRSRPLGSVDVEDGMTELEVSINSMSKIELRAYRENTLVARRIL